MVGFPSLLTFWVYGYFYPLTKINIFVFLKDDDPLEDTRPQHIFLLCLVAWLITVGPKLKMFKR